MTVEPLVDVVTGEVIAVALTAQAARDLTDRIRQTLHVGHDLIVQAFKGSAWSVLGYDSWDAYCAGEFAGARMVRLDREQRREIVAEMRQAGMSSRAIASGIGAAPRTVARDLAETPVPDGTPEPAHWQPRGVGTDEARAAYLASTTPVIGLDGKTYQPPAPRPRPAPKRSSLPDAARNAGWDLRKAVERLERIAADDRFNGHQEQMAAHLSGHLTHAIEVCQDLLARVSNQEGA